MSDQIMFSTGVIAYATEQPAHGQVRVSNELRKRGTFISPSGVRSIWLHNGLENFKLIQFSAVFDISETVPVLVRDSFRIVLYALKKSD